MADTSSTPTRARIPATPVSLWAGTLVLAIVIAISGWFFIGWVSEYGRSQERRDLVSLAAAAAASLDPQDTALLQGTAADEGSPVLARVRGQLGRIRNAIPNIRFIYLVTQRQGRIVFLADAEPSDSPDYSPPGQVYDEAPDEFRQAFASPQPLVHGPYHDRWGDWITGLAAVPRPNGGPVLVVLGVDIGAGQYLKAVSGYRQFALAITGLFVISASLFATILWLMRRFSVRLQTDLAELRRAQERLRLSAAVIENSAEGVMVTDADLKIESVNPAFEQITGYPAADVVGRSPKILFSGKHNDDFFHRMQELVDARGTWRGEIWNRRHSGELYPQQTCINVLRDADGRISHYASVFSDNTVQNKLEQMLREMSSMDGLTGVANRRVFDEVLAREWARALRDGLPLSMLMADIDFFKGYNDRYGHLEGDDCLRQVAQAIHRTANRASDLVARYGGEEFAVILPSANAEAAAAMGERIRASVASLQLQHGGSVTAPYVTISVGVATAMPLQALRQVELIRAADHALYQAKRTGRNRVVSAANGAPADWTDAPPAPHEPGGNPPMVS